MTARDMTRHHDGTAASRDHRADLLLMRLLLVVCYPPCVLAETARRTTALLRQRAPGGTGRSIFAEAKSAAHAAVGYAFHA